MNEKDKSAGCDGVFYNSGFELEETLERARRRRYDWNDMGPGRGKSDGGDMRPRCRLKRSSTFVVLARKENFNQYFLLSIGTYKIIFNYPAQIYTCTVK